MKKQKKKKKKKNNKTKQKKKCTGGMIMCSEDHTDLLQKIVWCEGTCQRDGQVQQAVTQV